ncbi:S-layer homology domain-containing protein [Aminipila luticellarii]|uniref:DUF4430 domain-containing protein n=1 Tax=Aminipila luticellarii TaxID=2507160 RepID=A0A410PUA1_9FIRM|nr:S-layer homology domain-containing protein [Aminipila luticellarii]QAT42494.1 DUF4430 domain-containing protein [Aminipila luticellarii]
MSTRNQVLKKSIAFLLVLIMTLTMMPLTTFADSSDEEVDSTGEDQQNYSTESQIKDITEKIAAVYAEKGADWWGTSGTWWDATGMSAYKKAFSDTAKDISDDSKQAFINKTISDITSLGTTVSTNANKLANAVNGMSAWGYDPTALWTVNKTRINAVEQLNNIKLEDATKSWYSTIAPYVLLSLNQGEYSSDTLKNQYVDYLLGELENVDWSWGVDTPAMILQGLAPYYNREDVKPEIDKMLVTLSEKQTENGSYGSANSDASVIVALAQLGINPHTDSRFIKDGKSLMDGLLTYKMPSDDGFGYSDGVYNEYATQQSFLALIAASEVMKNGLPYNIYDFSKESKSAAYANGAGGKEADPADPISEKEMKVNFTLKADSGVWIPRTTVTLKSDATVYHAFTKALDEKDFSYVITNKNYVSSITNASGKSLVEFDKGKHSGWLYKVNDELPDIALTKYKLHDGDNVVWYYTNDWTKDPDAVEAAGGKAAIKEFEELTKENTVGRIEVEATIDKDGKGSADVSAKDISDAIAAAEKDDQNSGIQPKKEIKIVINADSKINEIKTKLPEAAVTELGKKVDVLTVQTPIANIRLDKQNLDYLLKSADGDVIFTVKKVELEKKAELTEENKSNLQEKIKGGFIFDFNLVTGDKKVSQFADNLQISVPYAAAESENSNGIVAYYIKDKGSLEIMKNCVYDLQTKMLSFSTDHFSSYAVGYRNISFNDISKHWAKDQIVFLAARDVVKGINDAGFAPDDKITRAEFVQMLANLAGADLSAYGDPKFKDVKAGEWFAGSAAWAEEKGLVTGSLENGGGLSFDPNDSITRQDMSVILSRYMSKIENKKLEEVNKEVEFRDKEEIGKYAASAVIELQKAGVINGKTVDIFAPKESATRAECSKMISVLMQNYL